MPEATLKRELLEESTLEIKFQDEEIYRKKCFLIYEERGSSHWVEWVPIERFTKSEAILFPSILLNKISNL